MCSWGRSRRSASRGASESLSFSPPAFRLCDLCRTSPCDSCVAGESPGPACRTCEVGRNRFSLGAPESSHGAGWSLYNMMHRLGPGLRSSESAAWVGQDFFRQDSLHSAASEATSFKFKSVCVCVYIYIYIYIGVRIASV